jgi:hypothetical protein
MQYIKEDVMKMISTMPDDVSIDDIMEELYFKLQVNQGLQELDEGRGIPHENVEKRMKQWLSR